MVDAYGIRTRSVVTGLILCLFVLTTPLPAATYYVSPDGSGDLSGSNASNSMPWATAKTTLTSGDTCYFRDMSHVISGDTWPLQYAGTPIAYYTNAVCMYDVITWTFNTDYRVGQFITGDIWVVGSATVNSVSPAVEDYVQLDDGTFKINGSQINPSIFVPGQDNDCNQSLDQRLPEYDADLQVSYPVVLDANDSLISVRSWKYEDPKVAAPGNPTYYANHSMIRPNLRDAAILTCVASTPDTKTFRPAYAGTSKVFHTWADVNTGLLPSLAPVAATPDWSYFTNSQRLVRPWCPDYPCNWEGDYAHPSNNMPNYGRQMSDYAGNLAVAVLLDDATMQGAPYNWPSDWKQTLTARLIQVGIDSYAIVENGGGWGNIGGGVGHGRKWPILFAGLMLDYAPYKNIGTTYGSPGHTQFMEDNQKFTLTQTQIDALPHHTTRTNCRADAGNPKTIIDDNGGDWRNADDGTVLKIKSVDTGLKDYWLWWDVKGASQLVRVWGSGGSTLTTLYNLTPGSGKTCRLILFPPERLGMVEWGESPITEPTTLWNARGYRTSCTANSLVIRTTSSGCFCDRWCDHEQSAKASQER